MCARPDRHHLSFFRACVRFCEATFREIEIGESRGERKKTCWRVFLFRDRHYVKVEFFAAARRRV